MVVGNGMIAKAFKQYVDDNNVIIFASGVSNSKEMDDSKFEREFELLKSFKDLTDKKLVYFSTCSIFDKSLTKSKYIAHKILIEEFIQNNFSQYIIFRLPNVIGYTTNNNTSFNFFKNSILRELEINIQEGATRYIIDIDDLSNMLPSIISSSEYKSNIINVCFDNKTTVLSIVVMIEMILMTYTTKSFSEGGSDYDIDNNEFIQIITKNEYELDINYNFNTLQKYLS